MQLSHTVGGMDVLAAYRAFLSVHERSSFTLGAAVAGVPQSAASRRIAALETHLGERLFDRTSRRVALTPFGRQILPAAENLVRLADALDDDIERARQRPFRLALPETCAPRDLALVVADARARDLRLDIRLAPPAERTELARILDVRAALTAVAPEAAHWRVPLGLAAARAAGGSDEADRADGADEEPLYVETLRGGRARRDVPARRIWIQPEDDVPHIRDRMTRLASASGLPPAQVPVALDLVGAVAEVLVSADLLLCSRLQAEQLDLHWRPIGELHLQRTYGVVASRREDGAAIRALHAPLAACLGARPADADAA
jgi:DNA-binding transcriptional LysR family regulator